jgi:hypothetical protein
MLDYEKHKIARCAWLLTRQLASLQDILCQFFHEEFIELDYREQEEVREQEMRLPF